jgi:hypothetical protein
MQESGNTFEFKTKKNSDLPLYVIPVRDIETPTVIETQTKQMIIGKRNDLLLDSVICFLVPHSDKSSDSNFYGVIFPTMELGVTSTSALTVARRSNNRLKSSSVIKDQFSLRSCCITKTCVWK